jgi:uncharacterized protein (DUF1778 family)
LTVRATPEEAGLIHQAAALDATSVSGFLISSALANTRDALADVHQTALPAAFFERLLRNLEEPAREIPALARIARR